MFNNTEVGVIEGEPILPLILLKEALKARVAAYKKAIEDTIKATAVAEDAIKAVAVVAEDTIVELSKPIELDSDNYTYTAFKDINNTKVIRVEDLIKSFFLT